MKRVRNWLMTIMCLSLITAVAFDWTMFCKIAVVVNAVVLLVCIAWDLIKAIKAK